MTFSFVYPVLSNPKIQKSHKVVTFFNTQIEVFFSLTIYFKPVLGVQTFLHNQEG